jgi:hypothetical protein
MVWINDTPHCGRNNKSAAKLLSERRKLELAAAKKSADKADGKPRVKPIESARKRLAAGETILFTRPKSWTWSRTGRPVANGVLAELKVSGELVELGKPLFDDVPGQTWGSPICSTEV